MSCNKCGEPTTQTWQHFCDACYGDVRSVTTSWRESKHPAMRAPEPELPERCAPELAAPYIAKCHELMIPEPEEAPPEPISQVTCQHTFLHSIYGADQCHNCMIFKHQFLYSIQVKPSAGVYEEGRR